MKFKFRRRLVLHSNGPVTNIKWGVPTSRRYRLVVGDNPHVIFIEFNNSDHLPTVKVTADGVRKQIKL